jgi:hypothetical protein
MTESQFDLEERLLDDGLLAEAEELVRLFAASIRTAEKNRERRKKP